MRFSLTPVLLSCWPAKFLAVARAAINRFLISWTCSLVSSWLEGIGPKVPKSPSQLEPTAKGPLVGLRKHSKSHSSVTKLLVILAKSFFPSLTFTTVALFRDVKTSRHADRGNLPGSLNGVAALSTFVNGHIKLHTSRGPKLLDVATHPVLFDPVLDHETCDWSGGPRLVLVAFSVCNLDLMPTVELTQLRDFGLPLPSLSVTVPYP